MHVHGLTLNKRCFTLPVVYCRSFALDVVFWRFGVCCLLWLSIGLIHKRHLVFYSFAKVQTSLRSLVLEQGFFSTDCMVSRLRRLQCNLHLDKWIINWPPFMNRLYRGTRVEDNFFDGSSAGRFFHRKTHRSAFKLRRRMAKRCTLPLVWKLIQAALS